MSVGAAIFFMVVVLALAYVAQYYKVKAEKLAEGVLAAHQWVDDIIEALQDPDTGRGDRKVDALVEKRLP
jgi:hypothetical protein